MIKISKGLTLPILGAPSQKIDGEKNVSKVAIVASDYNGMKPSMLVQVGDIVKKGQALFEDKKQPGVIFTAPVYGEVLEINRGEKRVFQSIVIKNLGQDQVSFKNFKSKNIVDLSVDEIKSLLVESGLWTSLRTRPFSKTPSLDSAPTAIFINAMDTQPLAPNPELAIADKMDELTKGIEVLSKLTQKVFVTVHPGSKLNFSHLKNVSVESFEGPHPAGLVGTHIHFLNPVSDKKIVWHINYQDTACIGELFKTGQLNTTRVISLAGPCSKNPRLVKAVIGSSVDELSKNETNSNEVVRKISGSVLGGRTATGVEAYLGRFHLQVTLLKEGNHREFLGWHSPGINKFSVKNVFLSKLIPGKLFNFDTNTNGSVRSIVPIGSYEAVVPLDILPTHLLRYLISKNTDQAIALGALELDEEDLALCTYVDPCKNEFGPILRENLNIIEKEG